MIRLALSFVFVVAGLASAGCGPSVDCDAFCAHTLACNVTFAPSDDPDGAQIVSGERTEAESCALGCEESPVVTVDHATCVDGVNITADKNQCKDAVLVCLELPTE